MITETALIVAGVAQFLIGMMLGWIANDYFGRTERRSAKPSSTPVTRKPATPVADLARDNDKKINLLDDLSELVVEHTESVEAFRHSIKNAPSMQGSVASQVRQMRDANQRFDQKAQAKSGELLRAASDDPGAFGDVSDLMRGHRDKTTTFDQVLGSVGPQCSPDELRSKTAATLQQVLESKRVLETELSTAQARIQQQEAQLRAAEQDARIDALTRLPNRRAFDEQLEELQSLFERRNINYSLVMLDIDHFKIFNDTYGHAAGDAVLQVVGKVLMSQKRPTDRAFRHGGEEFALLLQATTIDHAVLVADRMRKRIETSIVHLGERELRVTTSGGVAQIEAGMSPRALLEQADMALYAAKQAGRNCIRGECLTASEPVSVPERATVGQAMG